MGIDQQTVRWLINQITTTGAGMRIIKHGRATDEEAERITNLVHGWLNSPPRDLSEPDDRESSRIMHRIVDAMPDIADGRE